MFLLCSHIGGGHVEDLCGRSSGAGVNHAVHRNDRGLGAADPPVLGVRGHRGHLFGDIADTLGKSGMVGAGRAFRVDSSGWKHHH
jgi:hypothetical protein